MSEGTEAAVILGGMSLMRLTGGPYQENTYLLCVGQRAVIVDPGMGVAAALPEHLGPVTIEAIVLTHGHIDHVRDAGTIAEQYGVPAYINEADAFMLRDGSGVSEEARLLFQADEMTEIPDLRFYQDGADLDLLGMTFRTIFAPGHSPGSTLLIGAEFAFVGDVIFRGAIGRTDLPDSNPQAMVATLRRLGEHLPPKLTLLPGHGAPTTLAAERTNNPHIMGLCR